MSRILSCPSTNDFDLDHSFLVPEGWTDAEASERASEVHRSFQTSPDPQDWEAFGSAMKAAGFITPTFVQGPTWDAKPGTKKKGDRR